MSIWLAPFVVQGGAMLVDEFWFHRRRDLPRWERIGHPVDTASVLLCFALLCFAGTRALPLYCVLAALSCVCITKDEWIHKKLSSGTEQWLHSLLFLVHPLIFIAAWQLWRAGDYALVIAQTALIAVFGSYQLVYWNLIRKAAARTAPNSNSSI